MGEPKTGAESVVAAFHEARFVVPTRDAAAARRAALPPASLHLSAPSPPWAGAFALDRSAAPRKSLLSPSEARSYRRVGDSLVPEVPRPTPKGAWRSLARAADVTLPERASGAFRVCEATRPEVSIGVRLLDALDAPAEVVSGYVLYRDALGPGAHVLQRPTVEGTEDYVYLPAPPPGEALRYEVDVTHVAGVRLVPGTRTLELLAADGDPRLRMAPPRAVDAAGRVIDLEVELAGCSVDADARAPWMRAVRAPDSRTCMVDVGWRGTAPRYPLIVDPAWQTTGSMAIARRDHAMGQSNWNGIPGTFVAGGTTDTGKETASSELLSSQGSWSALGNLSVPRFWLASAAAQGSAVVGPVVVGGYQFIAGDQSAVDVLTAAGTWKAVAPLPAPNGFPRAASYYIMGGKAVLVTGPGGSSAYLDPNAGPLGQWTGLQGLAGADLASTLTSGLGMNPLELVVAVGGEGPGSTPVPATMALGFNTAAAPAMPWTAQANLNVPRFEHAAVQTGINGTQVLVSGGRVGQSTVTGATESWDPSTNTWTPLPDMNYPRAVHGLVDAGWHLGGVEGALAVGGVDGADTPVATAELLVPSLGAWLSAGTPSKNHVAGTVGIWCPPGVPVGPCAMAVGGQTDPNGGTVLKSVDVYVPVGNGLPCVADGECEFLRCACGTCVDVLKLEPTGAKCSCDGACESGHCAGGVCCDQKCDGACEACSAAAKGEGADGACGPVKSGLDPKNKCDQAGAGVCTLPGYCDGNGACAVPPPNTPCGAGPSCLDDTTQQDQQVCTSQGACGAAVTEACLSGYKCIGSACLTPGGCQKDADCVKPYACQNHDCLTTKPSGQACANDGECTSKVCGVEGICCDEACDAPCRSCYGNKTGAEDGQCLPVLPGKPDPKQTCKPQKACGPDGTCDGAGQCRAYAPKGTSCGSECKDDLQVALACDENGGCTVEVPPNVGCEGRGCDAQTGSCIPGCKTKSDCHDGYDCDLAKGTCVAEPAQCQGNSVVAAGKVTPCGAGQVCKAGACVAEGAGTGSGGASMAGAAPSGTTTDVKTNDGCGCRVAPERSGTGAAVGVLFALAAIVRRRHRPRSASRGPDA